MSFHYSIPSHLYKAFEMLSIDELKALLLEIKGLGVSELRRDHIAAEVQKMIDSKECKLFHDDHV